MKYYFFIIFIFLFCSFTFFKTIDNTPYPPINSIQKPIETNIDNKLKLLSMYKKALLLKEDKIAFCKEIKFLHQIQEFPLKQYLSLNLYSHCSQNITINISKFHPWLKKEATSIWYKKAKDSTNTTELMKASYSMYKLSPEKYLREKYLLTALKIAKQHNLPEYKKWQQQLYILSPRYIKNPTHSQILKVANDLRRVRNFTLALKYYRKLINNKKTSFLDKNESFKYASLIYKIQKNNTRYLRATLQWKAWLKKNITKNKKAKSIYYDILYQLARIQWTLNQPTNALKTLKKIQTDPFKNLSFFNIYRLKGYIFYEQKQFKKSILFFEKALKQTPPDTELEEQTKWKYAWVLKKANLLPKSLQVLKDLLLTSKSDYLIARVLFWIGRTYEDMDQPQKAQATYIDLIKRYSLSYYGFLAHYKLNRKIILSPNQNFTLTYNNKEYLIAKWLLFLNKPKEALIFLQYKALQHKKNNNQDTKKWLELFYYMAKAKSYFPLFKLVGQFPQQKRTIFFSSYTNLMFPMLYKKEIHKASKLFNIEKEFIYSLIRQESAWNPQARSSADAFGLTQIRPFVAKKVAKDLKLYYKNIYTLYNPKHNILLGTAFLKKMFKKNNFQFILTMASYNAGEKAVQHWKKSLPLHDALSFIEEIPYEETRTYVRLLIRNVVFYKLLTNPKNAIYFPKKLLSLTAL